jgi:nucleoside-diphosphate-sugar epimerase
MSLARLGVTGGRGVLGRALQAAAGEADWSPFPGDLRHATDVETWLESAEPLDAIFHMAAIVPTHRVEKDPIAAVQTNVLGTIRLLEAVRRLPKAPWVFIASSSHVYCSPTDPDARLNEDSPLDPVTLYGLTKLQAEEWARAYAERNGLSICIGRIFSFTSRQQDPSYFIPSMIRRLKEAPPGATLEIPGLAGTRDFLRPDEIARILRALHEKRARGVYNIGSGQGQSLFKIGEYLKASLNRCDVEIRTPGGPGAPPTHHLVADISKLKLLGIEPEFTVSGLLDPLLESSLRA